MLRSIARVTAAHYHAEKCRRLTHPIAVVSSLLYPIGRVAVLMFLVQAVYQNRNPQNLLADYQSARIYILTSAFLTVTLGFNNAAVLAERIRSGLVVFDLVRPHSWMATNIGERLGPRLANLIAPVLAFLLGMSLAGYQQGPKYYLMITLMVPTIWSIEFLISYIIASITLSTQNSWGLGVALAWPQQLLSGAMVPLVLVPHGLRNLAYLTPFPCLLDLPIRAALGTVALMSALRIQVFWIITLGVCSKVLYHRNIVRIRINGG